MVPVFLSFCRQAKANTAGQMEVYGIGNGWMVSQPLESSSRGWMQLLPMFFPLNIHFEDYSRRGITLTEFVKLGDWDLIKSKLQKNDYVLISFNLNNQAKLLNNILDDIQAKMAHAVVIRLNTSESARADKSQGSDPKYLFYSLDSFNGNLQREAADSEELMTDSSLQLFDAIRFTKKLASDLKNIFHANGVDKMADASNEHLHKRKPSEWTDLISMHLKMEAAMGFRKNQLPTEADKWTEHAPVLREKLMRLCGAKSFHQLDVDIQETGRIHRNGYSIRKIYFQTRPGIYATANLYVPDGKGPFPAIINMHGHWPDAKAGDMVQSCAISLALNGFVCLNIDAWGAGERTTLQNVAEYHGSNLGASLMDIGETLLGNQVTDNMRGVDLLCSLPFVDKTNIGATGASGGGNQTMWLSAMDTRIKACMPVVSVGTFQSYIMGSNCVCELMPQGLTCTEEAGVLGLIAPRAIKICSGLMDANPAFSPAQMLRTYYHAAPVFNLLDHPEKIKYQLFNTPHGYQPEMRSAMLGWFDQQLKGRGNGGFEREKHIELMPAEELNVFHHQKRDTLITTTVSHVQKAGASLKANLMDSKHLDPAGKRDSLSMLLMLPATFDQLDTSISKGEIVKNQDEVWQTGVLVTTGQHIISYKYLPATRPGGSILVVCAPDSASAKISDRFSMKFIADNFGEKMAECRQLGDGLLMAHLWGLGENGSATGRKVNGKLPLFHTVARAELWLGHTVMGEWVSDLNVLANFIRHKYQPAQLTLAAGKEVAIAALAGNALFHHFDELYLSHCPVSYLVDKRAGIDYFNMAVHIPHILNWGDIGLMAALNTKTKIEMNNPVSMTGVLLSKAQRTIYLKEYKHLSMECQGHNHILFH